jgi:hypothetical protein
MPLQSQSLSRQDALRPSPSTAAPRSPTQEVSSSACGWLRSDELQVRAELAVSPGTETQQHGFSLMDEATDGSARWHRPDSREQCMPVQRALSDSRQFVSGETSSGESDGSRSPVGTALSMVQLSMIRPAEWSPCSGGPAALSPEAAETTCDEALRRRRRPPRTTAHAAVHTEANGLRRDKHGLVASQQRGEGSSGRSQSARSRVAQTTSHKKTAHATRQSAEVWQQHSAASAFECDRRSDSRHGQLQSAWSAGCYVYVGSECPDDCRQPQPCRGYSRLVIAIIVTVVYCPDFTLSAFLVIMAFVIYVLLLEVIIIVIVVVMVVAAG